MILCQQITVKHLYDLHFRDQVHRSVVQIHIAFCGTVNGFIALLYEVVFFHTFWQQRSCIPCTVYLSWHPVIAPVMRCEYFNLVIMWSMLTRRHRHNYWLNNKSRVCFAYLNIPETASLTLTICCQSDEVICYHSIANNIPVGC